jgi:hypothetical protein
MGQGSGMDLWPEGIQAVSLCHPFPSLLSALQLKTFLFQFCISTPINVDTENMINVLVPSMIKATLSPKKIGKTPFPLFFNILFLLGSGQNQITQTTYLMPLHGR